MNLHDLFERIHADNMARMWHYCIGAGIALSLLVAASWIDGRNNDALDSHSPEACARKLGITWDREDGATEKLNAFNECVGTSSWRCFVLNEGPDHIDVVRVAPGITWPHPTRQVECP